MWIQSVAGYCAVEVRFCIIRMVGVDRFASWSLDAHDELLREFLNSHPNGSFDEIARWLVSKQTISHAQTIAYATRLLERGGRAGQR